MTTGRMLQALVPIDLRNVRRDPLLLWVGGLPLLMALVIRLGLPVVAGLLHARTGFDMRPYDPLIMGGFVLLAPAMVGMVIGFLLLDERDDRVLAALLVAPLPLRHYLLYRISMPTIVATGVTLISYPVAGLVPLAWAELLGIALLAALAGPFVALTLAAFAPNKVAGFAVMKTSNGVQLVPLMAFFVAEPWQYLAGLVPSFWPMKALWLAAAGAEIWPTLAAGLLANLVALALLAHRFETVAHR